MTIESIIEVKTPWIVRRREWLAALVMAPFAFASVLSPAIIPEKSLLEAALEFMGWLCFWSGALMRWWATLYIGGKKNRRLLVHGPYSICRNPLYVGSFLLAMSIAFFLHSVIFGIGVVLAAPIYFLITVPWEESQLARRFEKEFASYRERVPRVVPNVGLFKSPPHFLVSAKGLRAELGNSLLWMGIPFWAELGTMLQNSL